MNEQEPVKINEYYSFRITDDRNCLIYDKATGEVSFAAKDSLIGALCNALDGHKAEWEYNDRKSKSHVEPVYTCSNCGVDAWGDMERTPYCCGCGAEMTNPWEGDE